MMKDFLLLFSGGDQTLADYSPEQMQQHMAKWQSWIGTLNEEGCYLGGNPLSGDAKTISGTDMMVTDGPFAEAKEVVGGYLILRAADLDQATEKAKGSPIYELGGRTEVRPIQEMNLA